MKYLDHLETAITYIESNLGSVNVEEVARQTGYSYYHLTRLFSAVLGESVGNYIKKRRLADAAQKLLYSDKRVIDIALENGFKSPEAFSRAFKMVYKISPVNYRRNRLNLIVGSKKSYQPDLLRHVASKVTIKPRVVEMPGFTVVGIRGNTSLNENVIPQLWQKLNEVQHLIPNMTKERRGYGICEHNPEGSVYEMNGEVIFSEFVGYEVEGGGEIPADLEVKTVLPGKFAVFTHSGSLENLWKTYEYIWGTWLLVTNEVIDNRDDYELYDDCFKGYDHPETCFDICIPIK